MRAHRVAAVIALAWLLAATTSEGREPFYVTPIPDEATRLRAKRMDGAVYDLYSESHALLVGLSDYKKFEAPLLGVKTEVGRLADVLHLHGFKVEVHFDLTTVDMIPVIDGFMRRRATVPESRILVYVAGHGKSYSYTRPFGYLLPVDAPHKDAGEQALTASAVPMQMFAAWAEMPAARHMLFVFDACFSGSFFRRPDGLLPPPPLSPPSAQPTGAPTAHAQFHDFVNARGPEDSDYVFRDAPRQLGRQFLTAGGARETVPASSVFSDLFIQVLEGSLTARANSNFDHWTTGKEIGEWLEGNASGYYKDPKTGPIPVFGSLRDGLFESGNMIFTRLDFPNPHLVTSGLPPFPKPGTVAEKVGAAVLAGTPQESATATLYTTAVDATRAASSAEALARRREEEAKLALGNTAEAARSVEQARNEAEAAKARAASVVGALEERILSERQPALETPQDRAAIAQSARLEIAALGARNALVPPPREDRTLSPDDEKRLQGIVNDLTSDDRVVRREARQKMSRFLAELPRSRAATATSRLLQSFASKSYRFQLGVAVALSGLPATVAVEDSAAVRTELKNALAAPAGRDSTLRRSLTDALNKLPRA